ncbi:MAG TPA: hypothetical protein VJV05_15140 [Pyrinomonadaceae bacterium]|nr:hypothetical protein [Pyrinomonadaceae bacterium]
MNLVRMLALVTTLVGFSSLCVGQNPIIDDDVAPPPLKVLSQTEKTQLAAETEVKRRTKLALELMDVRLKQSETLHAAENYDQMFVELGGFHGLMDNMLEFLDKSDRDSKKVIYNFKRFEIGLRAFTPRLELMRRILPIRYERYVRNLIKNLRNARAKAIEPLFDDTVVPPGKKPDESPL